MNRGMGFIPDKPHHSASDVAMRPIVSADGPVGLFRSHTSVSRSREWFHLVDSILDQGMTQTCWPHFLSTSVYLSGLARESMGLGQRIPRPSIPWSYFVARATENGGGELVDVGTSPRHGLEGAATYGLVAEDRWPFDPRTINEPPPLDCDLAGADALLTGAHFTGPDTSFEDFAISLDHGFFPGLALDVYSNFEDANGTAVYDEPRGDWKGLHMVTAVSFRPGQSGDGEIAILNSWGKTWGDGGFLWMSARFLRSPNVKHRTVLTAVPAPPR